MKTTIFKRRMVVLLDMNLHEMENIVVLFLGTELSRDHKNRFHYKCM